MTISEINRSTDLEQASATGAPAEQNAPIEESPTASAAVTPPRDAAAADAPARPPLHDKAAAPVLVKLPPPFTVRLSQVFWVMSLAAGAAAIVYLFIIRKTQLPLISDLVKSVDGTRAEATYAAASDIIFWSVFGLSVAVVFLQIVFQVSFANRRPHARWWQFGSLMFQAGLVLIARELVAVGEQGLVLERILLVQLGLAVLGLLFSLIPNALRWTARRYDVRRGPVGPAGDSQR